MSRARIVTGILLFVVSSGGCSWTSPIGAHRHVLTDEELIGPTVTILAAGKPVPVELTQSVDAHKSGKVENVQLRVLKAVRVGDMTVIEAGTEATGTVFVTTPRTGRNGEVQLQALSTTSVTGAKIPLLGGYVATGSESCESVDCLRFLWDEGGYAALGEGTKIDAVVADDIALPTAMLQSYLDRKLQKIGEAIRRCEHRLTLRIYRADRRRAQEIFLDGKSVGHLGPSSVLTLVPSPGSHIISTHHSSLSLDLEDCTPYYVRLSLPGSALRSKTELAMVPPERGEYESSDLPEVLNDP